MQYLCGGLYTSLDCLGRTFVWAGSFPNLRVMDGFLNLCPTWRFAVYLEYFFRWCNVWRVLRWWPVQQLFKIFPPSLQLVFNTGKGIAILIFHGSVRVLVVSC